jgi:hypothetical protein
MVSCGCLCLPFLPAPRVPARSCAYVLCAAVSDGSCERLTCFIATCHNLGQKRGVLSLLRRDALALCEEGAEASQDVLAGAGDAG